MEAKDYYLGNENDIYYEWQKEDAEKSKSKGQNRDKIDAG